MSLTWTTKTTTGTVLFADNVALRDFVYQTLNIAEANGVDQRGQIHLTF